MAIGHPRPSGIPVTAIQNRDAAASRAGLPFLMFCLYTFILIGRPQDYVPSLQPFRLALVFTVLTSLVTVFRLEKGAGSLFRHTETKLYFLLFGVMCTGIPFSLYRRASFDFVILTYIANMAFYVMFLIHVNTLTKFKRIIFILTLSVLIFTLVGIRRGEFLQGRFMTGSQMFDSNDVAFVEVSFLAFGVCILLGSFGALAKILAFVSIPFSVLLALYTGSRGGLLGLAAFLLLFLVLRIPGVKKSYKAVLLALVVVIAAASLGKINVQRYSTLANLGQDYNSYEEQGRVQVWKRGLRLLLENPLIGVGANRFDEAIGLMRAKENLAPYWQAPHNSFVQVLTETGIFGGSAFLLLILTCLKTFNGLRRRGTQAPIDKDKDTDLDVLPGILLIGFVAQLVSAFFLSQAYSMPFTLFFAASASLKQISTGTPHVGLRGPI